MSFDARAEAHVIQAHWTSALVLRACGIEDHFQQCDYITGALKRAFAAGRTEGRDEGLRRAWKIVLGGGFLNDTSGEARWAKAVAAALERERTGGR